MYLIHHPDIAGDAVIAEQALASYAARGWVLVDQTAAVPSTSVPALAAPAPDAGTDVWRTYAVATGMPFAEAMGKDGDELAASYGDQAGAAPVTVPGGDVPTADEINDTSNPATKNAAARTAPTTDAATADTTQES